MEAPKHSRSASADTTGSGHQHIYTQMLEHVFTYPASYEIPLRTMYAINSAVRSQPRSQSSRAGSRAGSPTSNNPSPTTPQSPWQDPQSATAQFTSALMAQLCSLPSPPTCLPPSFINTFVRRCFDADLTKVDFTQGLTALDYLKDLEARRRKDVDSTFQRLGVQRDTVGTSADRLTESYPCVAAFVRKIEGLDRKAEGLYAQLWIALRRWILINEFSTEPFNQNNCVAMLNTLYPPVVSATPSPKLTTSILAQQREGFFKYIKPVKQKGSRVLATLKEQNKRAGEETGWPAVHELLQMYLHATILIIDECTEAAYDDKLNMSEKPDKRKGRKVDSGVSFNSNRRPSTSSLTSNRNKSLPSPPAEPKTPRRGGSAFHKIAKRLLSSRGRFGDSDMEIIEISEKPLKRPVEKPSTKTVETLQVQDSEEQAGTLSEKTFEKKSAEQSEKVSKPTVDIYTDSSSDCRSDTPVESFPQMPEENMEDKLSEKPLEKQGEAPAEKHSEKPLGVRKMRSLSALAEQKQKNISSVSVSAVTRDDSPLFDKAEMQRHRALYDARYSRPATTENA